MSHARNSSVVVAALTVTVGLPGCGGGTSDKDQITALVSTIGAHPKNFCNPKYATSMWIARQEMGGQPCPWNTMHPWKIAVKSVAIHGSTAKLSVLDGLGPPDPGSSSSPGVLNLVKQGGNWKVNDGGASNAVG